ncbi:hypothetical protein J1605_013990 [Eschrichtius robustus]|uniref:Uncharacterized protein n=1 Tax=Eschrichtius robustus TaxID=9764 RepID=A0AB34GGY3_ESCRO|nr:hypothetical protein J1605_013990 [Eschrichtius robustus]
MKPKKERKEKKELRIIYVGARSWHLPSHTTQVCPHTHPCAQDSPPPLAGHQPISLRGAQQAGAVPSQLPRVSPERDRVGTCSSLCSVASPFVCSPVTQHMKALLERNTKKKSKLRKKPKPYVEEPDGRASPAAPVRCVCTALLSGLGRLASSL